MIRVKQAVIVEGKYDKIKLSSVIDAYIIPTNGFRIFKDKEMCAMIRSLAATTGIIVLTDSDSAGLVIRNFIKSIVGKTGSVIHLYIPEILGKEKRKAHPSKSGTLGVEGVSQEILQRAFRKANIGCEVSKKSDHTITKTDFYVDGMTGHPYSSKKREQLLERLNLPTFLSANHLLEYCNATMDYSQYKNLVSQLNEG